MWQLFPLHCTVKNFTKAYKDPNIKQNIILPFWRGLCKPLQRLHVQLGPWSCTRKFLWYPCLVAFFTQNEYQWSRRPKIKVTVWPCFSLIFHGMFFSLVRISVSVKFEWLFHILSSVGQGFHKDFFIPFFLLGRGNSVDAMRQT